MGPITQKQVTNLIDSLKLRGMLLYILVVACLGFLFDSFDTAIISYLMPSIQKEWGLDPTILGLIASSALWGTALGQFLWGPLADRLGRKWAFQGTLLTFGLITGFAAFMWDPYSLSVARFLAGLGLGGFISLDAILVGEMAPTRIRGRMISITTLSFPLGQLLGVICALLLLPFLGWRMMFVLGAVPAILAWFVRRRVPESPRWLVAKGRYAEAEQSLCSLGISEAEIQAAQKNNPMLEKQLEQHSGSIRELFTKKYVRPIVVSWMTWIVIMGYFGFVLWFPSILVAKFHYTIVRSLSYTVIVTLVGLSGRLVGIALIDKIGRKWVLIYTYFSSGLLLLLFGSLNDTTYILPLACLFYFFADQSGIAQGTYTAELFPTHLRGLGTSLAVAIGRIAAAIGPVVAGSLMHYNHYTAIWILFSALYFLAVLTIGFLGVETKGRPLDEIDHIRKDLSLPIESFQSGN